MKALGLLLLACVVMLAGCAKPKAGLHWSNDWSVFSDSVSVPANPDFTSKDYGHPCIIVIPSGHDWSFKAKGMNGTMRLSPAESGKTAPEGNSAYGCNFEFKVDPAAKP